MLEDNFFPRSASKESGGGDGHDKGQLPDRKGGSSTSLHDQELRPSKEEVHKNDHWMDSGDGWCFPFCFCTMFMRYLFVSSSLWCRLVHVREGIWQCVL